MLTHPAYLSSSTLITVLNNMSKQEEFIDLVISALYESEKAGIIATHYSGRFGSINATNFLIRSSSL